MAVRFLDNNWVIMVTHASRTVVKKIEKVIEKIPGLGPMIEELMNSIAVLVFTSLEVSHGFHSFPRF